MATSASARHVETRRTPDRLRTPSPLLHAKPLPLAPDGPAQVLQLRLNELIDGIARAANVVGDVLANLVSRNPIPRFLAALGRPTRASDPESPSLSSGPICSTAESVYNR